MSVSILSDSEIRSIAAQSATTAAHIVIEHLNSPRDSSWPWISNREYLRVTESSKTTAQRQRDSGVLPYSKIGGKVFYRRSDVEALLEKNLRKPAGEVVK